MTKHKIVISFQKFSLQQGFLSAIIRKCICAALQAENVTVPCEINVLVTGDREIHAINQASRGIDKPTDVLSFPMFELDCTQPPEDWTGYLDMETGMCPLGDMVISLERAVAQAKEYGHTVRREVGYLTVHSVLHFLGYDHMDEGPEKKRMREREKAIVATIPGLQRDELHG